jgi:Protein of unknown function, DUF547
VHPLNLEAADIEGVFADPADLSQQILTQARTLSDPEQSTQLDGLTGLLRQLDPAQIEGDDARIAFWLNTYNALLLHRLHLHPVRGSILRKVGMFAKTAYRVGEHRYTLNVIEHGLLRRNRRAPLHVRRPLRASDPRLAAAPSRVDARVHFALNCGARSCPPIRAYDPAELDSQLDLAAGAYLRDEAVVDGDRIVLPGLMRLYRSDFGAREAQLDLAGRYLPELQALRTAPGRLRVRYGKFDWTAAA